MGGDPPSRWRGYGVTSPPNCALRGACGSCEGQEGWKACFAGKIFEKKTLVSGLESEGIKL